MTADAVPDPGALSVRTLVNGELVREAEARAMLTPLPQLIAALSRHLTLQAGTVVLTGAPPRLGDAEPVGLQSGDEIIVEIEPIGQLRNPVQ